MHIEAARLDRRYPKGTVALESLNLILFQEAVHGLPGPNGAGKSTFLRHPGPAHLRDLACPQLGCAKACLTP